MARLARASDSVWASRLLRGASHGGSVGGHGLRQASELVARQADAPTGRSARRDRSVAAPARSSVDLTAPTSAGSRWR